MSITKKIFNQFIDQCVPFNETTVQQMSKWLIYLNIILYSQNIMYCFIIILLSVKYFYLDPFISSRLFVVVVYLIVSMLLALKLDQLIWAATRGRCNDEMIRLSIHTRYSQFPSVGSFTCLSIEHWIQGTLWLYVTCDWQTCWDFADEGHLKILGSPPWDRTRHLQRSRRMT